ncbi:MAG: electron transport complex subunit E [Calditrichaeota bacterium]|nr:MAG: electron transport complex subunit E [Calditrichota bacterium]MBL1207227.1 electron transport complex subunit E [Calditrichota bacterium]NOG47060.1 electron transport complex subunit E [Calditrichota bacterium]
MKTSSNTLKKSSVFMRGIWKENPVFRQLLGMCPTLAVTNSAENGLSMGLATLFAVVSSGLVISALRKVFVKEIRIVSYTVIIATFVTIADLFMAAKVPEISKNLGPYIPLIVVNCLILGRQEAFTSKNKIGLSLMDTLGFGLGFTWALIVLGAVREILGSGTLFNFPVLGNWFEPWVIMVLPAGAFITLGFLIALVNYITQSQAEAHCK